MTTAILLTTLSSEQRLIVVSFMFIRLAASEELKQTHLRTHPQNNSALIQTFISKFNFKNKQNFYFLRRAILSAQNVQNFNKNVYLF